MIRLNQLVVIEGDPTLEPLIGTCLQLLQPFSKAPVSAVTFPEFKETRYAQPPQMVLLHTNLTKPIHLQLFTDVHALMPYTSIIIVSTEQDEPFCLQALEAGADDSVLTDTLTENFLRKAILIGQRRQHIEEELAQSRRQLMACIEKAEIVAIQWYNAKGEVVLWNQASERIFGLKASEAIGKTIDDLFAVPQNKSFWLNKLNQITTTSNPTPPEEWSFKYPDGSEGCCLSTLFPIPALNNERWVVCMDVEITDRKKMEKALLQSETRYRTLFNEASDAIIISNKDGRLLEVNSKAAELLGYSKEQMLQMNVQSLLTAETPEALPIIWTEMAAGKRTAYDRQMLTATGHVLDAEITAQMLQPDYFMAIVRNVSDRKKVEHALQQSEEKYRSLVEQQADAIAVFNQSGEVLDVNNSALEMLQYTREELMRLSLSDILSEEDLNEMPVDFALLQAGQSTIKQRKMRRKDGTLVNTEVHTKQFSNNLFITSVRDLTLRLQVQQQLEKEIALSDSIINSLPGLFYLFDEQGVHLRWNQRKETITGYNAEEMTRLTAIDFIAPQDRLVGQQYIEDVFAKGSATVEARLLTKDGREIPYFFSAIRIYYNGQRCILGTGLDLSEVKNLEKQLSDEKIAQQRKVMQAMLEAEEKEKNKLGLEMHDNINQILSVVKMYLSILQSGEPVEGITIGKTHDLLNTAIEEIRDLSHSLAISYRFEIGLKEALQSLVEKVVLTRGFALVFNYDDKLEDILHNTQRLAIYRIVQELLNNIIKYARATEVRISIQVEARQIMLRVVDNGQGFNPAQKAKGIGLNNISTRAETLGGMARIRSGVGKGCSVTVRLPLERTAVNGTVSSEL